MAARGPRGQFDKAKHPYAFPDTGGALAFARKSSSFEKLKDAIVTADGVSANYLVNKCNRFTIKVYSTTSITCVVQVCADPNIGDWYTVATLDNTTQSYSTSNLFTAVRVNVTALSGTGYVWLIRDYGDSN